MELAERRREVDEKGMRILEGGSIRFFSRYIRGRPHTLYGCLPIKPKLRGSRINQMVDAGRFHETLFAFSMGKLMGSSCIPAGL